MIKHLFPKKCIANVSNYVTVCFDTFPIIFPSTNYISFFYCLGLNIIAHIARVILIDMMYTCFFPIQYFDFQISVVLLVLRW